MRSGFSITPSIVTSEPGTISAATSGKGGRGGVGRHDDLGAAQLRLARRARCARPPAPVRSTRTVAPKWRSMRSVWSRVASRSITVVTPGELSPASSTADLIWAEAAGVS